MFISPFADIFTGLTSRHEGSASACRAAFRPNLVVVSLEEPYLMLRFPQLGFGFEALALGFLQRCELLFGGFDTKFYGGIEGLCCLVKQLARSLRIGGAQPDRQSTLLNSSH